MNWHDLKEAARLTGKPESTLRRMLNSGEISGRKAFRGKRDYWEISDGAIQQLLGGGGVDQYGEIEKEWRSALRSGLFTRKPVNPSTIKHYEQGMKDYWEYLKEPKRLENITIEKLRLALSMVGVDHENRNCHYGIRLRFYMAYRSIIGFLIYKGVRTEKDLIDTKALLPRRVYPARKTVLTYDDLKKLLSVNDTYKTNRTDYDIVSTRTLMMVMSYVGLRVSEACNLRLSQVDLKERIIRVHLGKGFKDRRVGIPNDLVQQITDYLKTRPETEHTNLLVSRTGQPLDANRVWYRIKTVAKKAKLDITPHGLRRTFATVNVKNGMPLPVAQKLLGHTDIKTTMEYVMIDEMQAVDYLRGQ
ncbi:MAG: integrase family protein [Vampirovibrio sp.]|jgi:integrase/recombinase XerD|nr:integrase family protein [Vampirovibrio sp.]